MPQSPTRSLPVEIPPGYVKVDSPLAEKGRYIDGFGVRFFRGKPQKIGGFVAMLTAAMLGIIRGLKAWNDLSSQQWIAAGTTQKLYGVSNAGFTPQDITPFVRTSTATNPFTTTNGSAVVNVSFTAHLAITGQNLVISGASAVGGLTLNGEFSITAIVDNNNFQIIAATAATSGATGGGSASVNLELPSGLVSPSAGFGWNAGSWNQETWNTPRSVGAISFDPLAWSLGNFGKILLAAPLNGSLYSWDPTDLSHPRAVAVTGSNPPPSIMTGFFATAERFVIAFGTNSGGSQDLLQFHWCGQGDYTDWNASALTGTIGSPSRIRRVTRGRKIMNGADIGGFTSLMWTDSACYRHTYTGSAQVFDTQLAGVDCGLIGPNAFVVVGNTAYWMSPGGFFMSEGGGTPVRVPAQDDISEWVYRDNLRPYYSIKGAAWYNPRFDEVWFAFTSNNSDEPDLCAVFNRSGGFWFTEKLVRTAATRYDGQDARPILAGTDGQLYQHEQGVDANGAPLPWSLTTALFELDVGMISIGVESFYPDMERHVGTIALNLIAFDRSTDPPMESETETFVPGQDQVDFRLAGRELSMVMSGGTALGDDFRLGVPKVEVTDIGARA
jgi:hypothetical protein